jgi:hypothetical protein
MEGAFAVLAIHLGAKNRPKFVSVHDDAPLFAIVLHAPNLSLPSCEDGTEAPIAIGFDY